MYQGCLGKGYSLGDVAVGAHIQGICSGRFGQAGGSQAIFKPNTTFYPVLHGIQSHQDRETAAHFCTYGSDNFAK